MEVKPTNTSFNGGNIKIPKRYVPNQLSRRDKLRQITAINRSRKLYKNHIFYNRPPVRSFKSRPSNHIENAKRIYGVDKIVPNKELAKATGCSLNALKQIVKKGEGAYYSSGSRPNQTAQSWGFARLASAITAGNSSIVDYHILRDGCNHRKRAFLMAQTRKRQKR
jgi:hypothetical protein